MRNIVLAGALSLAALVAIGTQPTSANRGFNRAMCAMGAISGDRALREWCYEMQVREDERRWRRHHHRHHYHHDHHRRHHHHRHH